MPSVCLRICRRTMTLDSSAPRSRRAGFWPGAVPALKTILADGEALIRHADCDGGLIIAGS